MRAYNMKATREKKSNKLQTQIDPLGVDHQQKPENRKTKRRATSGVLKGKNGQPAS